MHSEKFKEYVKKYAIVALLVLMSIRVFTQCYFSAEEMSKADTYGRVGFWIESSACSAKNGSFLVICRDGENMIPIEEISQADDRGHTLIANAYGIITGQAIDRVALTRFNLLFNFGAAFLLLIVLLRAGFFEAAILFGTVQAAFGFARYVAGPDVPALYAGLAYTVASIAIYLVVAVLRERRFGWAPFAFVLPTVAIVGAIREPLGVVAIGTCFAIVIFGFLHYEIRRRLLKSRFEPWFAISLIALMISLPLAPKFISNLSFQAREKFFGVSQGPSVSSHGIAHNLYLGLGTMPNDLGVRWEDANAVEAARKIKPDVVVASPEYFDVLWGAYWKIVSENTGTVIAIYIRKLFRCLEILFNLNWVYIMAGIAIASPLFGRKKTGTSQNPKVLFAISALLLVFGGGLLQGILGQTSESFLTPAISSFEVAAIILISASARVQSWLQGLSRNPVF